MYIFSRISLHVVYFMHNHGIMLILVSHSCIIVTEPSEVEPVEPTESVEPESEIPFVVESEVNLTRCLALLRILTLLARQEWFG